MSHSIRVHSHGGPDVLHWEEVSVGAPGNGQVKIRHHAVGLNYIDVYHRTGLYKVDSLPFTPGMEGAGEVLEVGPDVNDFAPGDRIAYAGPLGGYAQERLIPAARIVKLPDAIDYKTGAAMMLQGMTAQYLLKRTYPVKAGDVILWHAAAGGVGLIACQWAAHLGAIVIGTVGSAEKAELAKAAGCAHVINYREENFVERVRDITGGRGVDVAYDGVGKDTFPASLDCIRMRGMWVSFGNASGPVPAFEIALLGAKGGLFATRPSLFHYTATRDDLVETAADLFAAHQGGFVSIPVNQTYPLSAAAEAHRDLEARKTSGSTVLIP